MIFKRQLLIVALLLLGMDETMAKSDEGIYTGIEWANQPLCWVDDIHFVFLQQNKMNLPAELARPKGLYLVDATRPTTVQRLDLSPLPPSIHEEIGGVSCQAQTVVFYHTQTQTKMTDHYSVRLGGSPQHIAQWQFGAVSLTGRYLLMSRSGLPKENAQGQVGQRKECTPLFVQAGFTVHCWDFFLGQRWPLATNVLAEYKWRDTYTVRDDDGTKRQIPNRAAPLLGKDDKPILYALHLRDLDGKILATLWPDQKYRPFIQRLVISPDEQYLYAACSESTRRTDDNLGVCRYRLDGRQHEWEEVFQSELVERLTTSIVSLSVSQRGDVYFYAPAKASNGGIWRFDVGSKTIDRVVRDTATHLQSEPRVSPSGKWLLYVRSGKDGAKLMLMEGGSR